MNTHWNTVWSNRLNRALSLFSATAWVTLRVCMLLAVPLPRQDNHVQRCTTDYSNAWHDSNASHTTYSILHGKDEGRIFSLNTFFQVWDIFFSSPVSPPPQSTVITRHHDAFAFFSFSLILRLKRNTTRDKPPSPPPPLDVVVKTSWNSSQHFSPTSFFFAAFSSIISQEEKKKHFWKVRNNKRKRCA